MPLPFQKKNKLEIDILEQISSKKHVEVTKTATKHNVSRTAVYNAIKKLEKESKIFHPQEDDYRLWALSSNMTKFVYKNKGLEEDIIWRNDIKPSLGEMSENALRICHYAFVEMMNNAIEHSESNIIMVKVFENALEHSISITDLGVGIFAKIQKALNLPEKRFAILELAKGKFTTDPQRHSGEGIFFTSRMCDMFFIVSEEYFFRSIDNYDIMEDLKNYQIDSFGEGTFVRFYVRKNTRKVIEKVFSQYENEENGFDKTIVPVRLLEYGEKNPDFISRSQARRLLTHFDKFQNIVLDFKGVKSLGQGFADEIFRVFKNEYPDKTVGYINCVPAVKRMINHVKESQIKE